ncbi:GNAT family N-acetyltransferase [Parasphingorhabdus pacifica]
MEKTNHAGEAVALDGFGHVHTERLCLRNPIASDLAAMHEIHSDPETNRYNPFGPLEEAGESAELLWSWMQDWECQEIGYWVVRAACDDAVLGFGGVRCDDLKSEPVLNLYYRFSPRGWGQGFASEVARAAVRLGREYDPERLIIAVIREVNEPSRKVAERIGMIRFDEIEEDGLVRQVYRMPPV